MSQTSSNQQKTGPDFHDLISLVAAGQTSPQQVVEAAGQDPSFVFRRYLFEDAPAAPASQAPSDPPAPQRRPRRRR